MNRITEASHSRKRYQVYLLRIWQEGPEPMLRISLEDAATRERHTFVSLEKTFSFLHRRATSDQESS